MCMLTGETCLETCASLVDTPVLVVGAILPAPAVSASARIAASLKRVQAHSSAVYVPPMLLLSHSEHSALLTLSRCAQCVDKSAGIGVRRPLRLPL